MTATITCPAWCTDCYRDEWDETMPPADRLIRHSGGLRAPGVELTRSCYGDGVDTGNRILINDDARRLLTPSDARRLAAVLVELADAAEAGR
jgi:hypothetical protein